MDVIYPKKEKLKSQKHIDLLFTKGKSVSKYPLRLVYAEIETDEKSIEFGVSVSKKNFKKAVDRNYFKRVLRECYRANQGIIHESGKNPMLLCFFTKLKTVCILKKLQKKRSCFLRNLCKQRKSDFSKPY